MDRNLKFIGRDAELKKLDEIAKLGRASIIVVHGRRRVGKTTLIERALGKRGFLKIEGIEGQDHSYQIDSFLKQLARQVNEPLIAKLKFDSWREPLLLLAERVATGQHTIFIEELQWMADYQDDFIAELKFVWDNAFSKNPHLILVLCGSSPSFMVANVIRSRALYNRSLFEIPLLPFSLVETHQFLGQKFGKGAALDAMLMVGGIPEYLRYLKQDSSPYFSFCKNAFTPGGFFVDEINRIFVSSLAANSNYRRILEEIGKHNSISRDALLKKLKLSSGSNITKILNDLEVSGLIYPMQSYNAAGSTRGMMYEIRDPYLRLFYRFVAPNIRKINLASFVKDPVRPFALRDLWQALGFAFEHYCRINSHVLAEVLGFGAVEYTSGPLLSRDQRRGGVQLDLVFARADRVLSICEIKYISKPADIGVAAAFERKLAKITLSSRQKIETVLIAPNGVTSSLRSANIFDRFLDLDDLS